MSSLDETEAEDEHIGSSAVTSLTPGNRVRFRATRERFQLKHAECWFSCCWDSPLMYAGTPSSAPCCCETKM